MIFVLHRTESKEGGRKSEEGGGGGNRARPTELFRGSTRRYGTGAMAEVRKG